MTIYLPDSLVSTEWLAANLGAPNLCVLDATVHLHPDPSGSTRAESGLADFEAGHIPGAVFADLIADLSDIDSPLRFTLPTEDRFAAGMGALGVGDDSAVVVYAGGSMSWAPRLWLMLRAFGFDHVAVLDGGWKKWSAEGRAVSTETSAVQAARFTARLQLGVFVDQAAVEAGRANPDAVVVNALSPAQHAGTGGAHYGRPGRITDSVNVPAAEMLNLETFAFLPNSTLARRFDDAGATADKQLVIYCGGGIAASQVAFAQHLLGRSPAAVYDASLQEWARDSAAAMTTDTG